MNVKLRRRVLIPGFILILTFVATAPSDDLRSQAENGLRQTDLSGYVVPPKNAHPKIDSALLDLSRIRLEERPNPAVRRIDQIEGDPRVRIVIESTGMGRIASQTPETMAVRISTEILGGRVEAVSGHLIQALLPSDSIESLAASPFVSRIRLPYTPKPEAFTSEGVARTGADKWHTLSSYRSSGRKVKIGILDLGFKGYRSLLGTDLPPNVSARSFRTDRDIEADTAHGLACAEIVHDMAPEADIYLVNFGTDVEQHAAVDYLIAEKIDIVSYSLGWSGLGAGDGTGPICDDVKKCAAAGILWVSAAGDNAESHWEGTFTDSNSDSFHNFSAADEILQWWVPANAWTGASLNWDDWGAWDGVSFGRPTQDYDLLLWRWTGSAWELLQDCDNFQNSLAGQKPVEETSLWKTNIGTYYGVSILKFNASRNCILELQVQGNSDVLEYAVPAGSLTIPADAVEAIAVGATDWNTDAIDGYSSRGPTHDGRIKPDLTAPSGVSTATYGSRSFAGTSASAPHVAGALGLLLSNLPYSPAQARKILESRALDLGATGKDNLYGFGRLNLLKR